MNKAPKKAAQTQKAGPNFLIDFAPLLIFFATNFIYGKWFAEGPLDGILAATLSLMITMPLAMAWSWKKRGHIPKMLWISGVLVLIFGGLTLYLRDDQFIKMKPTVFFTLFGLILLTGYVLKKPFIKHLFETAFPGMEQRGWMLLTLNWGLFFLFKAGLNEFIWRNFSNDTWVTFKTFGFIILTFLFMIAQIPILKKYGNLKLD